MWLWVPVEDTGFTPACYLFANLFEIPSGALAPSWISKLCRSSFEARNSAWNPPNLPSLRRLSDFCGHQGHASFQHIVSYIFAVGLLHYQFMAVPFGILSAPPGFHQGASSIVGPAVLLRCWGNSRRRLCDLNFGYIALQKHLNALRTCSDYFQGGILCGHHLSEASFWTGGFICKEYRLVLHVDKGMLRIKTSFLPKVFSTIHLNQHTVLLFLCLAPGYPKEIFHQNLNVVQTKSVFQPLLLLRFFFFLSHMDLRTMLQPCVPPSLSGSREPSSKLMVSHIGFHPYLWTCTLLDL